VTSAGAAAWVGQTWSTPTLARVRISGASQNSLNLVLVMAGGYDQTQDNDQIATFYHPDTLGNRIYMVDAESGNLLCSQVARRAVTPDLPLLR